MIPWCDHTGTPAGFEGFLHFVSSTTLGSASRMARRMRARSSRRQSPGSASLPVVRPEGSFEALRFGGVCPPPASPVEAALGYLGFVAPSEGSSRFQGCTTSTPEWAGGRAVPTSPGGIYPPKSNDAGIGESETLILARHSGYATEEPDVEPSGIQLPAPLPVVPALPEHRASAADAAAYVLVAPGPASVTLLADGLLFARDALWAEVGLTGTVQCILVGISLKAVARLRGRSRTH